MKIIGIIPSRYASERFPAKALVDIGGKTMVQRVYEQASKCKKIDKVVVATDHPKIKNAVEAFGGNVRMTATSHRSGTDRCCEVLDAEPGYDFAVNIQGDEPFIDPLQVDKLTALFDTDTEIATLVKRIEDVEELSDPNIVKCVTGSGGRALYFSRSPIPYLRNAGQHARLADTRYFKHIGLYGYRSDVLREIAGLPPSPLEQAESLEQLRWLENGYNIRVAETHLPSVGIDTPEDLKKAERFL